MQELLLAQKAKAWTITKLARNVPLVVLKKSCYFSLWSKIQNGHHGLWLAETFSTSQEPLHGRPPNLPQMFLLWSGKSVVTFHCDWKSKMAAIDSDWTRYFRLFRKNHCMDNHQTCHKCFFYGPEEVLLLSVAIGNPRWPPWKLIGWDILHSFSRTTVWTITNLATNVSFMVLRKCCYFSLHGKSKMATMDSDWLIHFRLLLKHHCMGDHQTYPKCSSSGPEKVLLLFVAIGNPRWPPWTDWPRHFWLLENHCIDDH